MSEDNTAEIKERIAFLEILKFEDNKAVRGGCLITDLATYPQEFRVTTPIRPTNLQFMLYGNSIDTYIGVELLCIPLVHKMQNRANLLIVRDSALLVARPKLDLPMISLADITNPITHAEFTDELDIGKRILAQLNKGGHNLLEPFNRVQSAIAEAHRLRVGEEGITSENG